MSEEWMNRIPRVYRELRTRGSLDRQTVCVARTKAFEILAGSRRI